MAMDIKNSSKDIKVVLVENLNFFEVVILKVFQEKQMYVVQCQPIKLKNVDNSPDEKETP